MSYKETPRKVTNLVDEISKPFAIIRSRSEIDRLDLHTDFEALLIMTP